MVALHLIVQATWATPAKVAGVTDRLWEDADIAKVLVEWEHHR